MKKERFQLKKHKQWIQNSVEANIKDIAVLGIQKFKNNSSICRDETLITQLKNKNQKFMEKKEGRNRKKATKSANGALTEFRIKARHATVASEN